VVPNIGKSGCRDLNPLLLVGHPKEKTHPRQRGWVLLKAVVITSP
jgi:hypothetical protein